MEGLPKHRGLKVVTDALPFCSLWPNAGKEQSLLLDRSPLDSPTPKAPHWAIFFTPCTETSACTETAQILGRTQFSMNGRQNYTRLLNDCLEDEIANKNVYIFKEKGRKGKPSRLPGCVCFSGTGNRVFAWCLIWEAFPGAPQVASSDLAPWSLSTNTSAVVCLLSSTESITLNTLRSSINTNVSWYVLNHIK